MGWLGVSVCDRPLSTNPVLTRIPLSLSPIPRSSQRVPFIFTPIQTLLSPVPQSACPHSGQFRTGLWRAGPGFPVYSPTGGVPERARVFAGGLPEPGWVSGDDHVRGTGVPVRQSVLCEEVNPDLSDGSSTELRVRARVEPRFGMKAVLLAAAALVSALGTDHGSSQTGVSLVSLAQARPATAAANWTAAGAGLDLRSDGDESFISGHRTLPPQDAAPTGRCHHRTLPHRTLPHRTPPMGHGGHHCSLDVCDGGCWVSQCDKVMNLSADQRCEFVRNTPDCAAEGGFINYPWITFCLLPPQLLPLAIFLYVLWLLVLFLVLGLIASELLVIILILFISRRYGVSVCVSGATPCALAIQSRVLAASPVGPLRTRPHARGLSIYAESFCPRELKTALSCVFRHSVAVFRNDIGMQGVTFLALGNGAPDVFSAMAAFSRPQTAGLAIGALFGAGIFVTTVVAGCVALVKPFTVASRPFLRDVIFYMAAVFWTFVILYKRRIELKEALGYLGLYVLYVITVVVSTYVYKRHRAQSLQGPLQGSDFNHDIQTTDAYPENLNGAIQGHEEEYEPLIPFTETTSKIFLKAINPVDSRTWRRSHWAQRALKIIELPFELLLLLTVPVVDTDKEDRNWKRPLNCLHLITGPLVCVLTFNSGSYGLYLLQGEFPVWLLTALIGLFLSGIVFCTTTNEQPPPYHFMCLHLHPNDDDDDDDDGGGGDNDGGGDGDVGDDDDSGGDDDDWVGVMMMMMVVVVVVVVGLFSLIGFVVSALWISTVASEVVSVLHLLGVILGLSNTVLGLTLLAWGNSIGDCFADITIARQGYPRMAISACFGGIIFNMLFGVGLGCLLQMFRNGVVMLEPEGLLCWVLAGALGLSLVLSFVLVPLQRFHLNRAYGIFLLLFYAAFLIIALLTEFKKIHV
ncbi:hypothetical protein NFI96_030017 [Prochilodus magdalenae]|nr:hypothetical protein NFI96_030017 [Prochilodus magdalenae]